MADARPLARRVAWLALALGMLAPVAGHAARRPGAAPDSVVLKETVRWLADPAREGRGVGTAGLDSAAAYLERRMRALGLRPAGDDGTWRQPFEVTTGVEVDAPTEVDAAGLRVSPGDDLQPLGFSTNGTLAAPVVFAGYGITATGLGWDDYAGLEVRDKLVLVLTQEPGENDSTSRFDGTVNTPFAELRTKAINAREHGALGLIVVNGPRFHAGEPPRPPRTERTGYMSSGLLAVQVSERVADALLKGVGSSVAAAQNAIEDGRPAALVRAPGLGDPRGDAAAHPRAHRQRGRPAAGPRHPADPGDRRALRSSRVRRRVLARQPPRARTWAPTTMPRAPRRCSRWRGRWRCG